MIERFSGQDGRRAVVESLRKTKLVAGDTALAQALAEVGEPVPLTKYQILIAEGGEDTEVYFILAGSCRGEVTGVPVSKRGPGDHVGEIAALDPTVRRSASIVVETSGVAWRVPARAFIDIADAFPAVWKEIAIEQAHRLRQRNSLIRPANDQPKVFLISSVEALEVSKALQVGLSHENMLVTRWDEGVFRASDYTIESLERSLDQCDFAIAVIAGEDVALSRDRLSLIPRDNVTFELGLFMGRLSRERTILVEQRDAQVKLASDLRGITTLTYPSGKPEDLRSRLGPVCTEIGEHIKRTGVRR